MAIAFDATTTIAINPPSDTLSHTCTGTNRYLIVGTLIQGSQTCTGVTYNGVAMTQLATVSSSNISTGETIYLFGLANPSSGTNNIVASFSGGAVRGIMASSFTGAQQDSSTSEATNSGTGASGTATVSVTTLTDNDWLVGFARGESNTTAGSGTTIRGATANINMMDSNGAKTPTGSYSLNFTTASNNNWASLVVALRPLTVATPTNSKFFFFMPN